MKYSTVAGDSAGMKFIFSLCFFFLMAGVAIAQDAGAQQQAQQVQPQASDSISDEQLEKFIDVYVQVVEIQQENEAKMIQAIEEENLDVERFTELMQAHQEQATTEVEATEDEMNAFNNAAQKIMEVQKEAQGEMQQLIEQDLGLDAYQQIVLAYQQSPEVQQRVNELLQEKMGAEE